MTHKGTVTLETERLVHYAPMNGIAEVLTNAYERENRYS